jgi:aspartate kinase
MPIVVHKYGGSSVADLGKIRAVAERIAATVQAGNQVVAVVSAMGNTTNELIALAREVSANPDRRELDMLISVGERVTMALLAMALRDLGVPARSLTGSQSGIITDEQHADAQVVEVRPDRLRDTIADGTVAIVAGFQGVSRAREVTTLGRGGSDTTAVVLAAALGADHCEICSDVDGVWSADPRIVREATKIDELSLDEGLALARGGAKVLFEDAVRYARDRGVTLAAVSTFGPGSGTRLAADVPARHGAVAVTSDDALMRVVGIDHEAWGALARAGARVREVTDGEAIVDMRNAHGGLPPGVTGTPVARVQAVGSSLGEHPARWMPARNALIAAGIVVFRTGAHGDVVWWEVTPERLTDAVRTVHNALL